MRATSMRIWRRLSVGSCFCRLLAKLERLVGEGPRMESAWYWTKAIQLARMFGFAAPAVASRRPWTTREEATVRWDRLRALEREVRQGPGE